MSLISTGSISLDSTFKGQRRYHLIQKCLWWPEQIRYVPTRRHYIQIFLKNMWLSSENVGHVSSHSICRGTHSVWRVSFMDKNYLFVRINLFLWGFLIAAWSFLPLHGIRFHFLCVYKCGPGARLSVYCGTGSRHFSWARIRIQGDFTFQKFRYTESTVCWFSFRSTCTMLSSSQCVVKKVNIFFLVWLMLHLSMRYLYQCYHYR